MTKTISSDEVLTHIEEQVSAVLKQRGVAPAIVAAAAMAVSVYIGHPQQTGKREPLGIVHKLELENGKLYATAYITDTLLDLVRRKVYKAVSAGFLVVGNNLKLDHIAFLNIPAVKGMEPLNFSEEGNVIMFSETVTIETPTTDFLNDSHALHAAAIAYQAQHGGEYVEAVRACLRQQTPNISDNQAPWGKHSIEEKIAASHVLHNEILERQAKFGGTYEEHYAAISQQRARGF